MKKTLFCTIALLLVSLASGAQTSRRTTPQQVADETYIRESEAQWAEESVTHDHKITKRILADDFVGVDPRGNLYDKAKALSETPDEPEFVSNHVDEVKVRFYGNTAVAQGSESWELRNGKRGRFVWTDTWVRRNGNWQIVAAEDVYAPPLPAKNSVEQ